MQKQILAALSLAITALPVLAQTPEEKPADSRLYELRTYHANEGKLDALLTRFRDHTCALFEKHGMENVAYFTPVDNKNNTLVYLLSYPDKAARERAWKEFHADPDWQKTYTESRNDGVLISKVDQIFMSPTDFSAGFDHPAAEGNTRLIEIRTYTTPEGKLPNLHARFRDHTCALFEKHGITNLGYFKPEGELGKNTLIYLIAHKDQGTATKSWQTFRADPIWIKAKAESEENGGGSLTTEVQSVFLKPTDFSPLK